MTTPKCLINTQSKNMGMETFDLDIVRGTYAWDLIYAAAGMAGRGLVNNLKHIIPHSLPPRILSGYRDERYHVPWPPFE